MTKHICIAQNDDGTVMVGEMPAEMMEGMDSDYLQPADNLNAALAMAREMLESDPEGEAEANAEFERGYQGAMGIPGMSKGGM